MRDSLNSLVWRRKLKSDSRLVWSDEQGDLRKRSKEKSQDETVCEEALFLEIKLVRSKKGKIIHEIRGLPNNKTWCKKIVKELKKKIGVGGAYKADYMEIHTSETEKVKEFLDKRKIKWKKIGG